jgi:hypothetical protein
MNSAWTPFFALCVLSVTLNQFCEMLVTELSYVLSNRYTLVNLDDFKTT